MSKGYVLPRLSGADRIGIALILAGFAWFVGWEWWAETRIWEPLNVPVSLRPGHVQTQPFTINTQATYGVAIMAREDGYRTYCLLGLPGWTCPDANPVLQLSWSVTNSDRQQLQTALTNDLAWDDQDYGITGRIFGKFHASKGQHVLELNVLQDASALHSMSPRLAVFECEGSRQETRGRVASAFCIFVLLSFTGACLIFRDLVLRHRRQREAWFQVNSLTKPEPQWPAPVRAAIADPGEVTPYSHRKIKESTGPTLPSFSSFALILFLVLLALNIWIGVIESVAYSQFPPKGLPARLLARHLPPRDPVQIQPILVLVEFAGKGISPKVYVNAQPVPQSDLAAMLRKELNLRPLHWPVYVQGRGNLDWGDVGRVIDAIRGQQAEVVLLTRDAAAKP